MGSSRNFLPFMLFSDDTGRIYSHTYLRMTGLSNGQFIVPQKEEIIGLPKGGSFFYLPDRPPIGFDPKTGKFEVFSSYRGKKVNCVSALPVPGYLRLYNPAYKQDKDSVLPLWAYTACGFYSGGFFICGKRVDPRQRQWPRFYGKEEVSEAVSDFLTEFPGNRLYLHLANCALKYNCLAAKNLFLKRWEAPLPTSQSCNARCLGCISYQTGGCAASHNRISFTPAEKELIHVMINHIVRAKEPIVSFGQGCEGEPLLEADLISKAVSRVRSKTSKGTIHLNTNASLPGKIDELCRAGIDSIRVSLNSARPEMYNRYFNPKGYSFRDVTNSILTAKKHQKFVSLNLFMFPGFTDQEAEVKALKRFVARTGVNMIQLRNLNIDPYYYSGKMNPAAKGSGRGLRAWLTNLAREFPEVKLGYFNLPKEKFYSFENYLIK